MNTSSLDRPVRIGIVIGTLEAGGAARMALSLLKAFINSRMQAQLYCLDVSRDMPLSMDAQEHDLLEDHVHVVGAASTKSGTLKKVVNFPAIFWKLESRIREDDLDVVISFMERANFLNLLGSRKTPRILSVRKHLSQALKDKSPLKRALVFWGYRLLQSRLTHINFNSTESARCFQGLYPGTKAKVSVIHNFYNEEVHRLSQIPLSSADMQWYQGETVVTCGRLVRVKGHGAILRAFAIASKTRPDARLVIVGGGELEADTKNMIKELGLSSRVFVTGFQTNPYPWVARATLFVLSSHAEGFPNALLEAMALGKPVISTDCPSGPRELIAPKTDPKNKSKSVEYSDYGVLTPPLFPGDVSTDEPLSVPESCLADAMTAMLEDEALLNLYAQRSRVRSADFKRDTIMKQWRELVVDDSKDN